MDAPQDAEAVTMMETLVLDVTSSDRIDVEAALDAKRADRLHEQGIGDADDAEGRLGKRHAERLGDDPLDRKIQRAQVAASRVLEAWLERRDAHQRVTGRV